MEKLVNTILSALPEGFDLDTFLKAALLIAGSCLLLGILSRLIFGKKSVLNQSVGAAIGIIFIYAVTVVIHSYGLKLDYLVTPLPFVTLAGDYMHIFSFYGVDYVAICGQLLNAVILAFLVNLVNILLDKGKNVFVWLLFRCLAVFIAMLVHAFAHHLLTAFLPEGLLTWAPVILLGLLALMLAVGALKFLVGVAIATVNPLIGFLYTFFFANIIGKQVSKAVLTTAILSAIVLLLNYLGASSVCIAASALVAYIPFLVLLLIVWYIVGKAINK